jgi:predicted ATPase
VADGGGARHLAGRAEELALLETIWGDAGARGAVIAGEAGVGKTALAGAFLERLAVDGVPTEQVVATASLATIPFGAFAHLVPSAAMDASPLTMFRALGDALAARAGATRLVLAVDDAHLLDEGSAALLHHLAAREEVFALATIRTGEPTPDAVSALWKDRVAERIDLQTATSSVAPSTRAPRIACGSRRAATHCSSARWSAQVSPAANCSTATDAGPGRAS